MRDLIIGVILGSLLATGIFIYAGQQRAIIKMELKIEQCVNDVERITSKIGPLPEKLKGKRAGQ
jgi:hypothetical protein